MLPFQTDLELAMHCYARFAANILLIILCFIAPQTYAEPPNLSRLKESLKVYHDSGAYDREIASVASSADQYIQRQVKINQRSRHPRELAIVLDIDETSLSYYDFMFKRRFCYDPEAFRQEILIGNAKAIQPILALYQHALSQHVAVFFVTGRLTYTNSATIRNLKRAGYTTWAGLYHRPNHYKQKSMAPFKTNVRAKITQQGYLIIATIGDQLSDLTGGYAQKAFKLPNPYYYLP